MSSSTKGIEFQDFADVHRLILDALILFHSIVLSYWNRFADAIEVVQDIASWEEYVVGSGYSAPKKSVREGDPVFILADKIAGKIGSDLDSIESSPIDLVRKHFSEVSEVFVWRIQKGEQEYQAIHDIFQEILSLLSTDPLKVLSPELLGREIDPENPAEDFLLHFCHCIEEHSKERFYSYSKESHPAYIGFVNFTVELSKVGKCAWHCKKADPRTIKFGFINAPFFSNDYLNLPFYLFHEWVSHAHSAWMKADQFGGSGIFEDGWLLYAEQLLFEEIIQQYCPKQFNLMLDALDFYISEDAFSPSEKYPEQEAKSLRNIKNGYKYAHRFHKYVLDLNDNRFLEISAQLANLDHYFFFGKENKRADLHKDFVLAIKSALEKNGRENLRSLFSDPESSLNNKEIIGQVIKTFYPPRDREQQNILPQCKGGNS